MIGSNEVRLYCGGKGLPDRMRSLALGLMSGTQSTAVCFLVRLANPGRVFLARNGRPIAAGTPSSSGRVWAELNHPVCGRESVGEPRACGASAVGFGPRRCACGAEFD